MDWRKFSQFSRRRFIVSSVSSAFALAACEGQTSGEVEAAGEGLGPEDGKADAADYDPDNGRLQAYSDRFSVVQGGSIGFMVSSPKPTIQVDIVFLTATSEQVVGSLSDVPGRLQSSPPNAAKVGAGWEETFRLDIPADWPSGVYAVRMHNNTTRRYYVTFTVREAQPGTQARLAVVMGNFTWAAYNKWGGASFYVYELDDGEGTEFNPELGAFVSPFVAMDRPNPVEGNPVVGARAFGERHLLKWLDANAIGYAILCDDDIHEDPSILQGYDAVLFNVHPEYVSSQMLDGIEAYLAAGGNVGYLGGNGLYWRVTKLGNQLECRKEFDISQRLHTHHEVAGQLGGRWREIGRPESAILGTEFHAPWYEATHGRNYGGYAVLQPDHWVFADTGLQAGEMIGETGHKLWHPPALGAASGFEIDRVTEHSPSNVAILAEGANDPPGAHMTYYDHPGGGGVFAASSILFSSALQYDPRLGAVVRNVIERFVGG